MRAHGWRVRQRKQQGVGPNKWVCAGACWVEARHAGPSARCTVNSNGVLPPAAIIRRTQSASDRCTVPSRSMCSVMNRAVHAAWHSAMVGPVLGFPRSCTARSNRRAARPENALQSSGKRHMVGAMLSSGEGNDSTALEQPTGQHVQETRRANKTPAALLLLLRRRRRRPPPVLSRRSPYQVCTQLGSSKSWLPSSPGACSASAGPAKQPPCQMPEVAHLLRTCGTVPPGIQWLTHASSSLVTAAKSTRGCVGTASNPADTLSTSTATLFQLRGAGMAGTAFLEI